MADSEYYIRKFISEKKPYLPNIRIEEALLSKIEQLERIIALTSKEIIPKPK